MAINNLENIAKAVEYRLRAFSSGQLLVVENLFSTSEWKKITFRNLAGWLGMMIRRYTKICDNAKLKYIGKWSITMPAGTPKRTLAIYLVR